MTSLLATHCLSFNLSSWISQLMKRSLLIRFFICVLALLFLNGCDRLYQNAADIQARKAMLDLIELQKDYHKKNDKYARNLTELQETGGKLEYHTGIVYLEIESANDSAWRAIALPAESITARVFAFDTNKGGYYEMDDEEVSSYVLGALNFIRAKQHESDVRDRIGFVLITIMLVFGLKTWRGNRTPGSGWVGWPFLFSFPPIIFAALTLNHMDSEIALSKTLQGILIVGVLWSVACVVVMLKGFKKMEKSEKMITLSALAICIVLMALINILVTTHTFKNYNENPDPLEKFIKPPALPPRIAF